MRLWEFNYLEFKVGDELIVTYRTPSLESGESWLRGSDWEKTKTGMKSKRWSREIHYRSIISVEKSYGS